MGVGGWANSLAGSERRDVRGSSGEVAGQAVGWAAWGADNGTSADDGKGAGGKVNADGGTNADSGANTYGRTDGNKATVGNKC